MCQKLPIAQLKEFSDMWMRTIKDGGGGGVTKRKFNIRNKNIKNSYTNQQLSFSWSVYVWCWQPGD